jgi:antirestriction protein ArdC
MAIATAARKAPAKRKPAAKKTATEDRQKVDRYQVITDRIITLLDQGVAPWRKSWKTGGSGLTNYPRSMSTGKVYRGINVFLLQIEAAEKGYSSPWWGTFKNIAERGGSVKGQHGVQIVLWNPLMVEDKEHPGKLKKIMWMKAYTVFNADQVSDAEGQTFKLPGKAVPVLKPSDESFTPIEAAEEAIAGYLADGPSLRHGGDRAYYQPGIDHVQLPPREAFETPEEYYATQFHELGHSTGHASRLNRAGIADLPKGHKFGDALYSQEELVAEMTAAFLSGMTDIEQVTLDSSARYLQSWINVLKGDKKLLIHAAQQAQKAADKILGLAYETETDETTAAHRDAA